MLKSEKKLIHPLRSFTRPKFRIPKLNAFHITRITSAKMSANFVEFLPVGSVFGHFSIRS